jgi:hypothetical protein
MPIPHWDYSAAGHTHAMTMSMGARVVREFDDIVKIRPDGDPIPVGTVFPFIGTDLPA